METFRIIFVSVLLLATALTAIPYESDIVNSREEFTLSGDYYNLKVIREEVGEESESIISALFEFKVINHVNPISDTTHLRLDCSRPVLLILMARDKVIRNIMCNSEVVNIYSPEYSVVGVVEGGKLETIKIREDYHVKY